MARTPLFRVGKSVGDDERQLERPRTEDLTLTGSSGSRGHGCLPAKDAWGGEQHDRFDFAKCFHLEILAESRLIEALDELLVLFAFANRRPPVLIFGIPTNRFANAVLEWNFRCPAKAAKFL